MSGSQIDHVVWAHKVAVLHDQAKYEVLMRTDPAYLSDDKDHILAAPDHT
jgi:hypothetical protein